MTVHASIDEGPTPARRPRPRRTRAEILDAAARIFHEKGYDAATMGEIADDLGILKGSLYYHIKSKEEMLYEILLKGHQGIRDFVESALRYRGTPLQRIRLFVQLDTTYCAMHTERLGVFFHDFRSLTEEHRAAIMAIRDDYDQQLRNLIVEAQKQGSVCPDLDPRLTAIDILVIKNSMSLWYRPDGPQSATAMGERVADFVVAGLACDPRTHVAGHRRQIAAAHLDDGSVPPPTSPAAREETAGNAPGSDDRLVRWFRRRRP